MQAFRARIKWADIMTFLLFFCIAAAIWYGHAMQSVRNTRVPVLITYTGKPGSIALGEEGLPDTVNIVVRDAGHRLNTYLREPLRLTIDLRPYIHGEKGTIQVPSDVLRRSISDILQGTSHLIETSPETITCTYFTELEKNVPVVADCELNMADAYQLVGQPRLNRSTVKIYGKDKVLNAIDTLYTQHVVLNGLTDTTDCVLPLALPKETRAEVDSVQMRIIAERFTEKKFTVPLRVKGVPEGYTIRLFPREVEVSVRMGITHFSQVQLDDIKAQCTYTPERKDKLDVEIKTTNPFITATWTYPAVVEFLLDRTEQEQ